MLILPAASIMADRLLTGLPLGWVLIGRWFVFWAVGIRLFIAGIRQVTKPAFTAKEIFNFSGEESFPVIRELGFSNISLGLLGIISLFKVQWCEAAAIAGGLYYGLAGILHVFKKPGSTNEVIAMVSDLGIFVLLAFYLFFTLLA